MPRLDDFDINDLSDYDLLLSIAAQYDKALSNHGPSPKGVFWSEEKAQQTRFNILSSVITAKDNLIINDFGCGYGAFFDYLELFDIIKNNTLYYGYDISLKMLRELKRLHFYKKQVFPVLNNKLKTEADYSFASGTFGLKLGINHERWENLVKEMILDLYKHSKIACAFNILDKDCAKKNIGLYYADKNMFLEYCNMLSNNKAELICEYTDDDFTIVIRK